MCIGLRDYDVWKLTCCSLSSQLFSSQKLSWEGVLGEGSRPFFNRHGATVYTVLRWFCRATHKVVYWVPWAPLQAQGAYLRRHTDMRGSVSSVTRTTVSIFLWKLSKNFRVVLSLEFSLVLIWQPLKDIIHSSIQSCFKIKQFDLFQISLRNV